MKQKHTRNIEAFADDSESCSHLPRVQAPSALRSRGDGHSGVPLASLPPRSSYFTHERGVRSRALSGLSAALLALALILPTFALATALPPGDMRIVVSGGAGELAQLDLDAGLDPAAAELAIVRGRERLRPDNAAVYYLQAMLLLPERGERLRSVIGTPNRFEILASEEFAGVLRTIEIDTLVRAALQCRKCDFQVDTSGGGATPLPHLREATWLIEYLAIRADYDLANGRPWSALRRYGDMRAVSRDIASGVGMVSAFTGMKLESIAQERFLDALPRLFASGIPASSIEAIEMLEERLPPTVRSAFKAESLFEDSVRRAVHLLENGGVHLFWRQLEDLYGLRGGGSLREATVRQRALRTDQLEDPQALASFAANELRTYMQHVARLVELMERPAAERDAGLRALNESLASNPSQGILARRFAPVLPQFAQALEEHQRKICAMRSLLAACALRESTGSFPPDLETLRAARPEVCTKDWVHGGDFEYSVQDETVTIAWRHDGPGAAHAQMTLTWPTD